jgi:hypothetical protein
MKSNRKCKICKTVFEGRIDKLYCSIQCKNYYHINLRKVTNTAAIPIDRFLHRNRSILLEVLGKNKVQIKVARTLLEQKKFRFKYHTHYHINSKGKMYHYVYDISWMQFSDDQILINRKLT